MKHRMIARTLFAFAALSGCGKGGQDAAIANTTAQVAQAKPPRGGSWADVVKESAAGGIVMGNPNAKVKLIEIASLGCPFCRKFELEGAPSLVEKYVKTGKVSWEFRPYLIHGPVDVVANLIARCNGPKRFFPLAEALYKDQSEWIGKIETAPQDKLEALQAMEPAQAFVAMADLAGLQDWAAKRGIPRAKTTQCLSDQQMIDREVQVTSDVNMQFPEFTGTPAFAIDGKLLPKTIASWDKLEPQLQAALK